jgi:hypothetical protein
VRRRASSWARNGLFPSGPGFGFSSAADTLTARVWIHDFEELDRQMLEASAAADKSLPASSGRPQWQQPGQAPRKPGQPAVLNNRAERAYAHLFERSAGTGRDAAQSSETAPDTSAAERDTTKSALAVDELLDRAKRAERGGKLAVAQVYLRLAADRGSDTARAELNRLAKGRRQP